MEKLCKYLELKLKLKYLALCRFSLANQCIAPSHHRTSQLWIEASPACDKNAAQELLYAEPAEFPSHSLSDRLSQSITVFILLCWQLLFYASHVLFMSSLSRNALTWNKGVEKLSWQCSTEKETKLTAFVNREMECQERIRDTEILSQLAKKTRIGWPRCCFDRRALVMFSYNGS